MHVKNLPAIKGITYKTPADDVVVSCVELEDDSAETTEDEKEGSKK